MQLSPNEKFHSSAQNGKRSRQAFQLFQSPIQNRFTKAKSRSVLPRAVSPPRFLWRCVMIILPERGTAAASKGGFDCGAVTSPTAAVPFPGWQSGEAERGTTSGVPARTHPRPVLCAGPSRRARGCTSLPSFTKPRSCARSNIVFAAHASEACRCLTWASSLQTPPIADT